MARILVSRQFLFLGLCLLFVFPASSQDFRKKYKGTIGTKNVTLSLIAKDGNISGTYYYEKFTDPISIRGFIAGKSIEMSGFDLKGNKIDHFVGQISQFDVHGISIDENSRVRYPFNFVEEVSLLPHTEASKVWLFISSLLLAFGAIALIVFIRKKSNKQMVVKFVESIDKNVNEKLNEREKGYAFEKYMTERLSDDYYRLLEWRSDKYYNGRYAMSSLKPDLEFERKNTTHANKIFSVECKYRSKLFNDTVDLGKKWKIAEYKKYSADTNRPVFLALGIGGKPTAPEFVYIIPIERINNEVIHIKDISEFKISRAQLFYDPELKTLK